MAYQAHKISATIPHHLFGFIEEYKQGHRLKSNSEVITLALKCLEDAYLEACYIEEAKELENNPVLKEELDLWDQTAGDGIEDEDLKIQAKRKKKISVWLSKYKTIQPFAKIQDASAWQRGLRSEW